MSALEQHLDDYLAIRHGLGFKLVTEQRALRRFVAFMDAPGHSTVTIELALRWVKRVAVGGDRVRAGWRCPINRSVKNACSVGATGRRLGRLRHRRPRDLCPHHDGDTTDPRKGA